MRTVLCGDDPILIGKRHQIFIVEAPRENLMAGFFLLLTPGIDSFRPIFEFRS